MCARKLLVQEMRKEGVEPYSPLVFGKRRKETREESTDEEVSWIRILMSLDPNSVFRLSIIFSGPYSLLDQRRG